MIKTVDGEVYFATHVITDGNEEHFAFDEQDLRQIKEQLEGVNWMVKPLTHSKYKRDRAKGRKYASRSEALDHVENGKKPKASKEELEARIEALETRISKLEGFGG